MRALAALACALVHALLGACHSAAAPTTPLALRPACAADEFWTGSACKQRGDGAAKVAVGVDALRRAEVEQATAALDAATKAGPLDQDTNIALWEQRGIAAAYVDDEATASAAFEMLLALDPGHFLSYHTSPKATFVFEKVRNELKARGAPAIDINWAQGQKVGSAVPLDVAVLADPKQFLRSATLYVRARGEPAWRAADVTLRGAGTEHHVVLPPVVATKPVSLELYLRAYDAGGNEVFMWADPKRPREIPLRYDPPQPWYRKWWVIAIGGTVAAVGTGAIVYAVTLAPPDRVPGSVSVNP
ncbi:MAG: hypothetical protein AB7O24_18350 [Kofleriaceae bacterium]